MISVNYNPWPIRLSKSRKLRQEWMHQRLRELSPEERSILRAAAPILQRLSQS